MLGLADVKSKLDIPPSNDMEDQRVMDAIAAATARVSAMTRLDFVGTTNQKDVLKSIRQGRAFNLSLRPVALISSVKARNYGGALSDVAYDFVDAAEGMIAIVGPSPGIISDPRYGSGSGAGAKWDVVEVTYNTSKYVPKDDLADAIGDMAAFIFRRARSSGFSNVSMGPVSFGVSLESLPPATADVIFSYVSGRAASA